jgi:hypothetical protein
MGCSWVQPIRLLGPEIYGVPTEGMIEVREKGVSQKTITSIERAQLSEGSLNQVLAHNRTWMEHCLKD